MIVYKELIKQSVFICIIFSYLNVNIRSDFSTIPSINRTCAKYESMREKERRKGRTATNRAS